MKNSYPYFASQRRGESIPSLKLLDAFAHARGSVSALQSSTHVGMMAVTTAVIVPFAQQSLQRFAVVMLASVAIGAALWKIYLTTYPTTPAPRLDCDP